MRNLKFFPGMTLLSVLQKFFKPKRIGFATDVDGVYDLNGNVLERLDVKMFEEMLAGIGESKGEGKEDVTGGMLRKLQRLYEMEHKCNAYVFRGNYENLKKFLQGEKVGTEVII